MEPVSKSKPRRLRKFAFFAVAIIFAVGSLAVLYQEELQQQYRHFVRWREKVAVKRCGPELPSVDEVRILHLEDLGASPSLGNYTVPLDKPRSMTIVAEKTLRGKDAEDFAALWRKQGLTTDWGAACHDPHHVMQFRSKGTKVADLVVCFLCSNVALPVFPSWTLATMEGGGPSETSGFTAFRLAVEERVGAHVEPMRTKKRTE